MTTNTEPSTEPLRELNYAYRSGALRGVVRQLLEVIEHVASAPPGEDVWEVYGVAAVAHARALLERYEAEDQELRRRLDERAGK